MKVDHARKAITRLITICLISITYSMTNVKLDHALHFEASISTGISTGKSGLFTAIYINVFDTIIES